MVDIGTLKSEQYLKAALFNGEDKQYIQKEYILSKKYISKHGSYQQAISARFGRRFTNFGHMECPPHPIPHPPKKAAKYNKKIRKKLAN